MTDTTETTTNAATDLISAKEVALLAGVNAKAMRRFIRNQDQGCGKGNRYGFTPTEAKSLIAAYRANAAKAANASSTPRSLEVLEALIADEGDDQD